MGIQKLLAHFHQDGMVIDGILVSIEKVAARGRKKGIRAAADADRDCAAPDQGIADT